MKLKWIIGCLSIALLSSCANNTTRTELPTSSPRATEIHKALRETVIPQVDLEYVSVEDAIKFWAAASRDNHPVHFEFRHTLTYPMNFSIQPTKQSASSTIVRPPKVTVRRKNITSEHLLDEICQQSNFVWTILGRVIIIKPNPAGPVTSS
jgi:hypothetical protein